MGKRTTTRHKEDNTFRFESQPAKISKISLNTSEIRHPVPLDDGANTSFYQTLQINAEKNNSEDFLRLTEQLGQKGRSLEQLVHYKDVIVKELLSHLGGSSEVLSESDIRLVILRNTFKEATELIVALAEDLRQESSKYLPIIVKTIKDTLLLHRTAEFVDAGFKSIFQLFQLLQKYEIERFHKYLKIIAEFWRPKVQRQIISLSAQSISIFARKKWQADQDGFFSSLDSLLQQVANDATDTSFLEGVAELLFRMVKACDATIHQFGIYILDSCLKSQMIADANLDTWAKIMENVIRLISLTMAEKLQFLNLIVGSSEDLTSRINLRLRLWNVFLQECPMFVDTDKEHILAAFGQFMNFMDRRFEEAILESVSILLTHDWTYSTEIVERLALVCPSARLVELKKILTESNMPFKFYAKCLVEAYLQYIPSDDLDVDMPHSLDPVYFKAFLFIKFFYEAKMCSLLNANSRGASSLPPTISPDRRMELTVGKLDSASCDLISCCELVEYDANAAKYDIEAHIRHLMIFKDIKGWCVKCVDRYLSSVDISVKQLVTEVLTKEEEENVFAVLVHALQFPQRIQVELSSPAVDILAKLLSRSVIGENHFSLWALKLLEQLLHLYCNSDPDASLNNIEITVGWQRLVPNLSCGYKMVRRMTLDIINTWNYLTTPNEELTDLCDRSMRLDECDLRSPDFVNEVSLYLLKLGDNLPSTISECQVAFYYILGLLHTNHKLVQEKCIQYLTTHFSSFWKKLNLNSTSVARVADVSFILNDNADALNDLMSFAKFVTFGLPNAQERIDVHKYSTNIFSSCIGLTQFEEMGRWLLDLAFDALEKESPERCTDRALVPILQFLTKDQLRHPGDSDMLYDAARDFLMSSSWLSGVVLELLISLKPQVLKQYEHVLKELNTNKNNESLLRFGVEVQNPVVASKHRDVVIPIVSRIMIQKFKGEKRPYINAVLRHVASFAESEILEFIYLAANWKTDYETKGVISLIYALTLYRSLMGILGYKYPSLLQKLGELVCDISNKLEGQQVQKTTTGTQISSATRPDARECYMDNKESDLSEEDSADKQEERAHTLIRLFVKDLFANFSKLTFEEAFLERIFREIVAPALLKECKTKTTTLNMLETWSLNQRFHVFFSKQMVHEGNFTSPALYLFQNLEKSTRDTEQVKILQILLNLLDGNLPDNEQPLLSPDHFPTDLCPNADEPIGLQLILWGWKKYISPVLEKPAMLEEFCRTGTHRRIDLISRLIGLVGDVTWNGNLCRQLLGMLQFFKTDTDSFCKLLDAIAHTLKGIDDQSDLLIMLSPWFSKITERRVREAISNVVSSAKREDLREIVTGLNSWEAGPNDTPNFALRHDAHEKCKEIIRNGFDKMLYTMIAYNCFYTLHEITEFGEHSNAIETLDMISKHKPCAEDLLDMKKFIDAVVLSEISKGIKHRDEKKFLGFVRTLNAFISNCHHIHGTLAELNFLTETDILEGLCNVKIHMRSRNMNKLAVALEGYRSNGNYISPAILMSYVMPLARHNLENEDLLGENRNELIFSSIQVVGNILRLVPYKVYLNFMTQLLSTPPKHPSLINQKQRLVWEVTDAFSYDLSATRDETAAMPENNGHGFQIHTKLDKAAALRCIKEIIKTVIPKLHDYVQVKPELAHKRALGKYQQADNAADSSKHKLPSVICLAKLIRKLPEEHAVQQRRPLIPQFCAAARSKNYKIRDFTRSVLSVILREFGHASFPEIVTHLMAVLQRGYEKHVLSCTISFLMTKHEELFFNNPGSIPVFKVIKICEDELFGEMRSEKDVQAIKEKTPEARRDNAGPILELCAKVANEKKMIEEMIRIPMKNLQERLKFTDQMVNNARNWLLSVRKGLAANSSLPAEDILPFLLEKLNVLSVEKAPSVEKASTSTKSIYEIASLKKPTPAYLQVDSVLVEFIYDVLWNYLKRLEVTPDVCKAYGPHLLLGLDEKTKQIETLSMRCLTAMIDIEVYDLERDNAHLILCWRKVILKMSTYCLATTSDPELVNAIFKFITSFLQSYLAYKIEVDDYKLMLQSIKCFLAHENCSTQAINLLRKLIARKYQSSEMAGVMIEVRDKSITSAVVHIRDGCRTAYMDFVRLCSSKQVEETLLFYLENLKYAEVLGRESAAITVSLLIQILPKKIYEKTYVDIFAKLIVAIDQETDNRVQIKLREAFKNLIGIESSAETLLNMFCPMLKEVPPGSEHTFCGLTGIILDTESKWRLQKLDEFLSYYQTVLDESANGLSTETEEGKKKLKQAICCILDSLTKLIQSRSALTKLVDLIGMVQEKCLESLHFWIKTKSLILVKTILRGVDVEELVALQKRKEPLLLSCLLFKDVIGISDLTRKLSTILESTNATEVEDHVLESLEVLAKITVRLHEEKEKMSSRLLMHFMKNLRHLITTEVTQNPEKSVLRTTAYRLYLAVINQVNEVETLNNYAGIIIRHCVRDTTDANTPDIVSQRAEEVKNALKAKIGSEQFLKVHAKTQENIATKRQENRAKKAENVILHPGIKRKRGASTGKKKGGKIGSKKKGGKAKKRKVA